MQKNKAVVFQNKAQFINCISKINGVKIDSAEDLDVAMTIYNLLEYSKNYRKTTDSLWNYYRDEPSNPLFSDSESFKYKASITGNTKKLQMMMVMKLIILNMMQIKLLEMKLKLLFH